MKAIGVRIHVTNALHHLCNFFEEGEESEFTTNRLVIINRQQELLTTFVRRFSQESMLNATGDF